MSQTQRRTGVLIVAVASAFSALYCEAADRLVFLRMAPSNGVIYISNTDGSNEHAITPADSLSYNPAWSPQGDWIAFTSERAGSADLFRMHPDGSGIERLTEHPAFDDQAAFSPDGTSIVFVSTRAAGFANLWILDIAKRAFRPLTSGTGGDFRPAWSPDGQWIAFSSDRGSSLPAAQGRWELLQVADIYVVHPDGSGLKRISEHGGFCGSPKWAKDSRSVIAHCLSAQDTWTHRFGDGEGNNQIVRIDIATGATAQIASEGGIKLMASLLPTGKIAWLRRDKAAHGIFYEDGNKGPSGADLFSPSWSPDGKNVAFSRTSTTHPAVPVKLWSRNDAFDLYGSALLPAYDPSGRRLALTHPVGDKRYGLFLNEDGAPERTILEKPGVILAPQWSRDGSRIAFGIGEFTAFNGGMGPADRINGGAQVGVVNADGSGFHLVTSGPNNNAFPSFSPDGKRIVYRTTGVSEQGLCVMNLVDGSTTQLTDEWDNFPVWSPKGNRIAFIRRNGSDFQIFTIQPDGKGLTQLTHTHGIDAHLGWSPDGERLMFTSSRKGFKDEALYTLAPQPYGEIFVMNADGSHVEQITDDQWEEGGAAWQPQRLQTAKFAQQKEARLSR
ncbi:MAG: PD40 domain-containing protein [Alphaproteobacteria bacterium]|nr:PD40 domain-containing protein [Alphaproteobacteria bacterium]